MKKITLSALVFLVLASSALVAADPAGIPGLSRFTLANGLEVYAYQDAAVPLVRIQVAFRAGAIAQGPESAGLFRLYERMLFGGSGSRRESPQIKSALASLGVERWNGGTGTERVDYWISLPSSELAEGLAFWAATLCSPSLDMDALEAEKDAVIQEIRGQSSLPDSVYEAALTRRLFSKYPWRRDPEGSEKAVRAATAASLRALGASGFVPGNAALFIGGDIDPEEARAAAEAALAGTLDPAEMTEESFARLLSMISATPDGTVGTLYSR